MPPLGGCDKSQRCTGTRRYVFLKTIKRGFVRVSTEIFAYVGLSRSIEELWIIVGVGVFLYVAHNYVWRDDIAVV